MASTATAAPSDEAAPAAGSGRARRTRRTSKATASAGGNGGVPAQRSLAQVRAWARENNKEVSTRGPIPAGLMAAYDEAHA
ncbi:Lsr2 family DNA-binding protein [Actinacidiphila soli]|uniref:Lsr2 family DNA-binding protein n=1 Tax=Actinacidiphila soli TaxID=2487275 RepID=UPI000FCC9E19